MTTRTFVRVSVIGLALLALLPAAARAQSAIAGAVKDTSGGVMPGVTVEAASPALIEKVRTAVTDEQGLFRILELRPGTYTVTFTLTGFNTVRREGVELPADFTATVNAEMRVGALEETVTVTGEAPLVDVQSTTRAAVYANDIIENLPTNRQIQSLAMYVPGVIGGLNIDGPQSRSLTIHGSRVTETNSAIDGMSDRRGSNGGQAVTFYMNEGSVQEVSIRTDGGNAEAQYAGVWMNAIPKEGSNAFHGSIVALYADENVSGDNLTAALKARGLTAVNRLKRTWDFNPNAGGKLMQDKLWWYGAYRNNQIDNYVANSYYDVNPLDWVYTPDLSRQAANEQLHRNYALRLTWQATPKHKLSVSYEMDKRYTPHRRAATTQPPEATTYTPFHPNGLGTVTWKAPLSNRLLIDSGMMIYAQDWDERRQIEPAVGFDVISATEDSTNTIFRASNVYGHNLDHPITLRSSATYVTGSHSYKAGFMIRVRGNGPDYQTRSYNGDMTFNLLNGVPRRVTLYATPLTPLELRHDLNADLGVFAQDSWTLRRLTLNYGVRFDYLNAGVPEQQVPAGQFVPARTFAAVENVPNWKDINSRLGASYDLFGTGRTAVKGTIGRYITGGTLASAANPVNTSVTSANRDWTDSNGNFWPDCDLKNHDANGECGNISDRNFGKANPRATRYDPDVLEGWGKRPYSWGASVGVQHQLLDSLSVDVGYYRRWYGNFTATDNLEVTPADYDPFCVTAPTHDARLPVAGQRMCGFYDIKPAKRGLVQNFITFASNFGDQTEIYNGVDGSATLRIRGGGTFSGGFSTGRIATDQCFVVDSPQTLSDPLNASSTRSGPADSCKITQPFRTQYKFYGVYPLPWYGIQASATMQIVPGPSAVGVDGSITASYVATSAQIAPSLGRNLASGANGTATVELLKPYTLLGEYAKQLDVRFSKRFQVGGGRTFRATVDIFNILNTSNIQTLNTRLGSPTNNQWQRPTQILRARYFQLGTQFDF